jgi:hypothetical protein
VQPWNDYPDLKDEEELETLKPLAETDHQATQDDEKEQKNSSNEKIKCDAQKSI